MDVGEDSVALKSRYEREIAEILDKLQDTVKAMEFEVKEQLNEQQELIRKAFAELQLKNAEYFEYVASMQDTNDRKIIDVKVEYETKLQQMIVEKNALQLNEATLEKKLSNATDTHNKWICEKADLLLQYKLDQDKIRSFENQLEVLRTEIRSREETLNISEMRLLKCQAVIDEVNKRKENFSSTVRELQDECDGLRNECIEKNERISCLTIELKQYKRDIAAKDLNIDALQRKLEISKRQTENEKLRRMTLGTRLERITEDVRKTSESIRDIPELKKLIFTLRAKYL